MTPAEAADQLELERLNLTPRRRPMPTPAVEDDQITQARRRRVLTEIPVGYHQKAEAS